ncbi:MAG: MFS transporter [Acidimicrobiia bacterium]|nr:MFS transporter [Acidimicrobiia bacterium]
MRDFLRTKGGRTFTTVWAGQVVSNVGSAITSFGLALWVFTETGSATQLATIVLAARLPMLVVSPFAGALVDRWNRRLAMVLADTGAALGTLATAMLLLTGSLEIWHLYITLSFSGVFQAFQFPAYSAATTLLVPKEHYSRAAGMVQLAGSVGNVVAPTLAALLIVTTGLTAVFVIDFATFLFAIATLAMVRFPEPERTEAPGRGVGALLAEARDGLRFVTVRRGLLVLLLMFSVVNFAFSFNSILLVPLLLSVVSETTAGTIVSISAFGLVGGSLLMASWAGPTDRLRGLFVAIGVMGFGFGIAGLAPSVAPILIGITIIHVAHPVAGSLSQAIWQSKVPPEIQGRVFAVRQVMAIGSAPVAFLLAGRLADGVFEPFMAGESAFAKFLGGILGTGAGRGIGLLYVMMGAVVIVTVASAWRQRAIRRFDETVPDVVLEPTPVPAH